MKIYNGEEEREDWEIEENRECFKIWKREGGKNRRDNSVKKAPKKDNEKVMLWAKR